MKITLVLLFALSLSSCYRDTKTCRCARENQLDFKNECRTVDDHITYGGDSYIIGHKHLGQEQFNPCYNPENKDEVAYILNPETPIDLKGHIVVVNLETGQHRFVSWLNTGFNTSKVRWSKNGMLYVSGKGIVDPNTSAYQAVQQDFSISNIEWTANGDKLLGWVSHHNDETKRFWETNYPGYKMVSISWPGLVVEPFPLFKDVDILPQVIAISSQNEIKFSRRGVLYYTNIERYNKKLLFDSDVKIGDGGSDYQWSLDGEEIYFTNSNDGIFKIKKGKNKQYRIKKGCPNRQYHSLTLSPDGDKIIAERRDIEAERDGTYISETTRLVIMDMDGCNEKVLFEDWDGTVVGRP